MKNVFSKNINNAKKCPFAWQAEAFNQIKDSNTALISAPTGSGKTHMLSRLVTHKLKLKNKIRSMIIVPQRNIGENFTYPLQNHEVTLSYKKAGSIKRLEDFIYGESDEDVIITTNAAFTQALSKMSTEEFEYFGNINIIVDEAHHSKHDEENGHNSLGKVISRVKDDCYSLTFATATPYRGDKAQIANFTFDTVYSREIEDHLSCSGIENITYDFHFYSGEDFTKAIKELYSKGSLSKTLIILPKDFGGKKKSWYSKIESFIGKHINLLDFADQEEGLKFIKDNPDYDGTVIAQSLFREGSDWPACEQIIMIGKKTSVNDLIQTIGRTFRKFPNKKSIKIHHLLSNTLHSVEDKKEKLNNWLKMVIAVMLVGSYFNRVNLPARSQRTGVTRGEREGRKSHTGGLQDYFENETELQDFIQNVIQDSITNLGDGANAAERLNSVRAAVRENLSDRDDIDDDDIDRIALSIIRIASRDSIQSTDISDIDYALLAEVEDPFVIFKSKDIGLDTLGEIREIIKSGRVTEQDYHDLAKSRGFKLIKQGKTVLDHSIWKCSKEHQWNATFVNIRSGTGCPICSGNNQKTDQDYHDLAKERGFKCLKIGKNVGDNSSIWQCSKGHKWNTTYNSIRVGNGCHHCSGRTRKTEKDYHDLAKERGYECMIIGKSTNDNSAEWKCPKNHIWNATFNKIKRGTGCPICSGKSKKTYKDYHDLAKSRGFKLIKQGKTVLDHSIWKCSKEHQWNATYDNIRAGSGCPHCFSLKRKAGLHMK